MNKIFELIPVEIKPTSYGLYGVTSPEGITKGFSTAYYNASGFITYGYTHWLRPIEPPLSAVQVDEWWAEVNDLFNTQYYYSNWLLEVKRKFDIRPKGYIETSAPTKGTEASDQPADTEGEKGSGC